MTHSQSPLSRVKRSPGRAVLGLLGPVVALALLPACGAAPEADETPAPAAEGATQNGEPLSPVAVLKLPNGNTLSFYDGKTGGIITESGSADTPPTFDLDHQYKRSDQLIDAWTANAGDKAVPSALIDLQTRLTQLPASVNVAAQPKITAARPDYAGQAMPAPIPSGSDNGFLPYQDGCGNGCCDYEWLLSTFGECSNSGHWPVSWLIFNAGSSYSNIPDDITFNGFVCSAEGFSTFKLDVGSTHTTFPVSQGHWQRFNWVAGHHWWGWLDAQDLTSSVNSSTGLHLHTYCGYGAQD